MLDQATYTPRAKAHYAATIRPAMMTEFGYKNVMQLPRLEKIVLNMGVGEAVKDTKKVKQAAEELSLMDKAGKPTRVGFRMEGDKKVRFAKTTGEVL